MKILYSVQATGNGHISRAMELLPYLQHYGQVDLFLSGANSTLSLDAPVKYRSKGLSLFYTCTGALDHWQFARNMAPFRMMREVRELPVERYDLVLNDFECITSLACAFKKVPSIHFGHQASFVSDRTPRPERKKKFGEWILKNYAKSSVNVGLHFQCYDDFILSPVIKDEILQAEPKDKGYITIYLPSLCDPQIATLLNRLKQFKFEVFSRQTRNTYTTNHITWHPVSRKGFNTSLINCHAIVTGAGFETPAEALHLRKKLLAIPIKGQYEQECNAAALSAMGITTHDKIDEQFYTKFEQMLNCDKEKSIFYPFSNEAIVDYVMNLRQELEPVAD